MRPAHPHRLLRLKEFEARRICLIKPSAFGDVIQCLPLLSALRWRFPRARISWVIKRELADLLAGHPCLDEIVSFDRRASCGGFLRFLGQLRRRSFDLVLDLQGLFRTALMTLATGAPWRVGLADAREGSQWTFNCVIPGTEHSVPAHQRYWRVAEAMGAGHARRETTVWTSASDREWVEERWAGLHGPVVAVHAGARWVTKRWPAEKFAAVAARAATAFHASIVLVGEARERPLADQIASRLRETTACGQLLNLVGQTTLKQLAALLQRVSVLLTNDSGPMHLAASLGRPVLAVFTCTSPIRSGPPGEHHELVTTGLPCAASYAKQCPHRLQRHLACLEEIDVDRVWQAFERLWAKNGLARRVA